MNVQSVSDVKRGPPLVSIGQGDYRRDYYPEDFGMRATNDRPVQSKADGKLLEAEVLGAALRYVAIADWFESRPITRRERARDREAMDIFNRIEAKLRQAGGRLLRRRGHRQLVLERALREAGES